MPRTTTSPAKDQQRNWVSTTTARRSTSQTRPPLATSANNNISNRGLSSSSAAGGGGVASPLSDFDHLTALPTIEDPRIAAGYRFRGTQNCLRLDTKLQKMELELKEFLEEHIREAIETEPHVAARTRGALKRGEEMQAQDQRNCDRQQMLLDELLAGVRRCQESSAAFVDSYLTEEEIQRYADA